MKRTVRMLHASIYAFCVMRLGGRLGRLCGSERAGRGCAVLLFLVCAVTLVVFLLVEVFYLSRFLLLASIQGRTSGAADLGTDLWGRDTSTDVHFILPSVAYADLSTEQQTQQRSVYAVIEEQRRKLMSNNNAARSASHVFEGAREPNAFRLGPALDIVDLPRPVEAVIDNIPLTRRPGTPPLPQLQTYWRTYTPEELYERYDDLDFIYSFVNGSESNHYYRKNLRVRCGPRILALEEKYFHAHTRPATLPTKAKEGNTTAAEHPGVGVNNDVPDVLNALERECPFYQSMKNLNNDEFLERFSGAATTKAVDERDRETDELRHSIRSVEQHVQWHRGRLVIVSPGHHPTWVDGARNFLAGMCGDASVQALRSRGTHLRLTTVHQDALMPYGMRFTADSHVIEQHIWRVRNTTAVHVYMNDDYFVNRDVAITDLFNEYGGTIVRTEMALITHGKRGSEGISWAEGVANTELFNIEHLEYQQEDHLPASLAKHWGTILRLDEKTNVWRKLLAHLRAKAERLSGVQTPNEKEMAVEAEVQRVLSFRELFLAANNSFYWEAALESPVTVNPLPEGQHSGALRRFYATHAPFAYCTNMLRHLSVRFRDDFAPLQLRHRERLARDLFVPFLYNAFIMARPWEASAQFLPYLLQLRHAKARAAADTKANLDKLPGVTAPFFQERLGDEFHKHLAKYMENASIYLDNDDGCAPATLLRSPASEVMYMRATDDLELNRRNMDNVMRSKALYFNINAGFASAAAADQVKAFLHDNYPTPVYLERQETSTTTTAQGRGSLAMVFSELMQLPVVGVVSYEEGACPLMRSLSLAFAGHHRGRVHVAVQRHGDGEADETLRESRRRLGHRIVSAVPATGCSYSRQVSIGASARGESIADLAARVIGELGVGVELPSTCGHGDGTSGGLRVRGFVVDARTPHAPVATTAALREALAMPGQTLALEDFRAVRVGPEERDVVLVLAREDAAAKAVHWITGASENDLLLSYPLPMKEYEDMHAPVQWSQV